jgi:putative membrane protein
MRFAQPAPTLRHPEENAMMWWNDYGPAPWMFFGPMFMLMMMAVCVLVMYFMMRGRHGGSRDDHAAEILKERFARGEIDKTEYDDRRRTLEA